MAEAGAIAPFEKIYALGAGALAKAGPAALPYVGADFPCELAIAAGLIPIRLMSGSGGPTPDADALLPPRVSASTRALCQALLDGACADARGLVICRSAEELVWLFYALRALKRSGHGRRLPPLHLHDVALLPRSGARDSNLVTTPH